MLSAAREEWFAADRYQAILFEEERRIGYHFHITGQVGLEFSKPPPRRDQKCLPVGVQEGNCLLSAEFGRFRRG